MEAVAENIYESNSDFAIRRRCEDREEYLRHQEYIKREMERMKAELEEKDALIASLQKQLETLK